MCHDTASVLCLGFLATRHVGSQLPKEGRKEGEVSQSCLTLCDPMDCSLPGSSVHGIFQARILEWVAFPFSRRSSWPRDWTWVSRVVGRHFTIWATKKSERGELKNWLKTQHSENYDHGIWSHHFMENRWGNSDRLYFWGLQSPAYGNCSHEIKRHLLLGRKVMTNLDSILKSRDITLPTKAHLVQTMVFPVVMYSCKNWTIKKAECWKIDAFALWC